MLEKSSDNKDAELKLKENFEAKQNLLGFFSLLLEIDKRNNPQNYQKSKNYEDNRDTNNPDKA